MSRVFAHGGLRLYLLLLLGDEPRHGYELIRLLEDRFMGMYTPSAGTIYPRLSALEDDGLVEHDVVSGRKVYRLTPAGEAELEGRRDEITAVAADAVHSARALATEIRDEVRSSVRDLRRELKDAVRDVKREERRASRETEVVVVERERGEVRARRTSSRDEREFRDVFRSLRSDLESFAVDVLSAARRHHLDAERLRQISDALLDAREAVIDVLDGRESSERPARKEP
ncbi:MAG: PadR family transcriptional regulator [Actinomycetota bacterium]|nr:PadR family transcriptional regulator [Actinomycetota bacterium]